MLLFWAIGGAVARAEGWNAEASIEAGAGLISYHESNETVLRNGSHNFLWTITSDLQVPLVKPEGGPFLGLRFFYGMDLGGNENWLVLNQPNLGLNDQVNDFEVKIFWPEIRVGYRFGGLPSKKWAVEPYLFFSHRWQWFSRRDFVVNGVPVASGTVTETFTLPQLGGGAMGRFALMDRLSLFLGGQYGRIFLGSVTNSDYPGLDLGTEGNHVAADVGLAFQIDPRTTLAIGYAYDQILLFESAPGVDDNGNGAIFPNSKTKMSYGFIRLSQVF